MEGVVQFGLIEFGEDGCSKQKVIGGVIVDFSWGVMRHVNLGFISLGLVRALFGRTCI